MFGISAFAQTSFASLANAAYVLALTEGFTALDTPQSAFNFPFTDTEGISSGDSYVFAAQFAISDTEGITMADSNSLG